MRQETQQNMRTQMQQRQTALFSLISCQDTCGTRGGTPAEPRTLHREPNVAATSITWNPSMTWNPNSKTCILVLRTKRCVRRGENLDGCLPANMVDLLALVRNARARRDMSIHALGIATTAQHATNMLVRRGLSSPAKGPVITDNSFK